MSQSESNSKVAMIVTKNLGMLFLGIYLVIVGLAAFIPVTGVGTVASLCAVLAGIFILTGK